MMDRPKIKFPAGSLLATLLGPGAPVEMRRAAQRLRAEGAPALSLEDGIMALAGGLADSAVSRSPAVLEALPPLFWIEGEDAAGGIAGWVVEARAGGLSARGFRVAADPAAVPEPVGTMAVRFGTPSQAGEDPQARQLRGLAAAVSLPELMAQMGEGSPVVLMPAEPTGPDVALLRGLRLSVAMPPESVPD